MADNEELEIIKGLIERNALVTDVRSGGLVLGASHDEGGIAMLNIVSIDGVELLWPFAYMEGGEYILNRISTEKYAETLKDMNSFNQPSDHDKANIKAEHDYTVYQINKGDAILVDDPQMIVNKFATLKYLHQLELLNRLYSKNIEIAPPFRYRNIHEKIH